MKVAILSDIHGNLPALEAVLSAIDTYSPDRIYCLGDLVNFAPWPNEVIDIIRSENISTIMGNHDDGIGNRKHTFPFSGTSAQELAAGQLAIKHTNDIIRDDNREYLKGLPAYLHLSTGEEMGYIDLLLTHGSPRDNDEFINEDFDENELLKLMVVYHADMMAIGHTHQAYQRIIKCGENSLHYNKRVINAGSVGRPTDGNWRPAFCIIEFSPDSNLFENESVNIEIHRVEYDLMKTYNAIIQSPIPDIYAKTLLMAGKKS